MVSAMKEEARSAGAPAHEVVYRALRDRVLYGDMPPGAAVTIQGLTHDLQAGMTPVREAIRRLAAEGALIVGDNRRVVVPVLDARAVAELTDARLAIEPLLAARAAKAAAEDAIVALETIDAALDQAIQAGDVPLYLRRNHAFHTHLNGIAGAPILASLTASLWLRFGPSMRMVCGRAGTARLPDRHKDLIAALRASDPDAAADAMRGDVEQGMALLAQSV